jgi:hypothetical protein
MPSISSIVLFSLAALGAVAAPAERRHYGRGQCVTDAEADQIATAYADLIVSYSDALADAVLAENFTDYSESVNTLINSCPQGDAAKPIPLLAPTFTSREQFKIGQGQQPSINFERLNLWHSCDTVIVRWQTTNTAPIPEPKPVVGLISMEVIKNQNTTSSYPWIIDTVYSAGAWLQNLVEAGICSTGAGLPSAGNATCSDSTSSSTIVSPTTPSTSTTVISTYDSWTTSTATWAPTSTATSTWYETTTVCTEEESVPTVTAY